MTAWKRFLSVVCIAVVALGVISTIPGCKKKTPTDNVINNATEKADEAADNAAKTADNMTK